MLDKQTRTAILALAAKGRNISEISRALGVSRNSVKRVMREGTAEPGALERASRLDEHLEDIRAFYAECKDGRGRTNMVRVWEKLQDKLKREGKELESSYSTLKWFCRERGIGAVEKVPAARIVTEPCEEMQHDTSPYTLDLGGRRTKVQCASLILGYSRMLYMQFYLRFQRFDMKIFLTEAFQYFGGTCRRCVIDNTSIAIACGSGSGAQMASEIEAFEERFSFHFLAHKIMHSDRKGKIERPYYWIETNFLVGRKFESLADLNKQAGGWSPPTVSPKGAQASPWSSSRRRSPRSSHCRSTCRKCTACGRGEWMPTRAFPCTASSTQCRRLILAKSCRCARPRTG